MEEEIVQKQQNDQITQVKQNENGPLKTTLNEQQPTTTTVKMSQSDLQRNLKNKMNSQLNQKNTMSEALTTQISTQMTSQTNVVKTKTSQGMDIEMKPTQKDYESGIKAFFQEIKSSFSNYSYQFKDDLMILQFYLDIVKDKYAWMLKFEVNVKEFLITSYSILCRKENEFYKVKDLHLKLLVCRNFSRLNSSIRFGCWIIHPLTGEISLKMTSYMDKVLFGIIIDYEQNCFKKAFIQFFKNVISQSRLAVQQMTPKIMFMVNEEDYDIFKEEQPENLKKVRQVHDDCLKKYEKCIKMLTQCTQLYKDNQDNKDYFKVPKQNINNGLLTTVYSKLDIVKVEKNENQFHGGGFAAIYRAKITYKAIDPQTRKESEFQRQLAVKQEKSDNSETNRIQHEKQILGRLEQLDNPYIAKFYYCNKIVQNEDQGNFLFMEYYPNKSLDNFKNAFKNTMSLNTKIYMLLQVAQGLKFLKENKITHLDLKPANILIQKNYIAKITDFGESFHPEICDASFRPGRTYPFVAPEVTQPFNQAELNMSQKEQLAARYSEKADIFSFGQLISEIIFDDYPITYKKGNQQQIANRYALNKYQSKLQLETVKDTGPTQLMEIIYGMIMLCIEDKDQRPYIEYLIIILRDCLNYIERLY